MRKLLYLGSLLSLLILLNTNISIAKDNHYNGHKNQFNKSGHVKYPHAKKQLTHYYNHKSGYKHYKYNKNKHQNHSGYNNHSKHRYYNNYRKHHRPYHYKHNYNHHASNHGYAYFNLFPHFLGYFYY